MAATINAVGALLLVSDDAEGRAAFHRDAVGLRLDDEVHEGVPLHDGCDINGVHVAIHPSGGWPGQRTLDAQSPVVVFHTGGVHAAFERLVANGVEATPFDHGLAVLTAFRDPDGNNVQIMTPTP
ncbi:MAG TPA: VOC family protein [Acidimicrobiales bacterium]